MVEKGVHFFGLCRMIGKESLLVGTAARNINYEECMFYFRPECLCI
jgi:hypothetical protein